jgi:hypothetical protein
MALTYQRNEDIVVRNASGAEVKGGPPSTRFRLIDRSAPYDATWHTSYQEAIEKGRSLAERNKVTLWYEPDPLRPGMTLVESFRNS